MDMRFYWMKYRVKQKTKHSYIGNQEAKKRGGCFTKHSPPHHRREICATYLYMLNSLLKINHKIVYKWAHAVITPIHTVAVTPIHTVANTQNRTVLQNCDNVVRTYGHTNTKTVT